MKELIKILTCEKRRLYIAESFTGGYLTSLFTAIPGASEYLFESIVCYNSQSKITRLNVSADYINEFGAVSASVCRKMILSFLCNGGDVAIATTGNAGPTAEKTGDDGVCFVGAGALVNNEITIFIERYRLTGNRRKNIDTGSRLALALAAKLVKKMP